MNVNRVYVHVIVSELKDAINRRNWVCLENAISNAKHLQKFTRVKNMIKQANDLVEHIKNNKMYSHEDLELSQPTISEIRMYMEPVSPAILAIMNATYIILGEYYELTVIVTNVYNISVCE